MNLLCVCKSKKKELFFCVTITVLGGVMWRAEFISQFSALNADRTLSLSNRSGLISANRTLPVS